MNWVLYAFGAALFWSLNILFDKYVVDHEIKDYILTTVMCSFSAFLVIGFFSGFMGGRISEVTPVHISLGLLYTLALMAYYSGIGREDVSRFAPTLAVDTLFITFFSFLFLGERFSLPVYGGVISVVAGAFLISLDDPVHSLKKFQSKNGVMLAVAAALIFASRDVIFKFSLSNSSYWTALLGMSIGGMISALVLTVYRRRRVIKSSNKGLEHLLIIGVTTALGYICFALSINTGPVSLASAVIKSLNIIIFAAATAIQKLHPEVVDEDTGKKVLIQKSAAITLIITGLLLIQLY